MAGELYFWHKLSSILVITALSFLHVVISSNFQSQTARIPGFCSVGLANNMNQVNAIILMCTDLEMENNSYL